MAGLKEALRQARAARGAEAARVEIVAPMGGLSMKKRFFLDLFLKTAFAAGAILLVVAGTAEAQKQGGSITVGQEVDIPGFDPLKVGVYDTSAETAAAAIFDTLTYLDDKGEPQLAGGKTNPVLRALLLAGIGWSIEALPAVIAAKTFI